MSLNHVLLGGVSPPLDLSCKTLSFASSGSNDDLNYFKETTISESYSGIWAAPVLSDIVLTRVGKAVTLHAEGFNNAVTGANIITGVAIPAEFRPAFDTAFTLLVTDNSATVRGSLILTAAGVILIAVNIDDNFTNAGNGGFLSFGISYSVA